MPRYHLLEPEYIHQRIAQLHRSFKLRVLLCHVDADDVLKPLGEVVKICLLNGCTLICAWSTKVRGCSVLLGSGVKAKEVSS